MQAEIPMPPLEKAHRNLGSCFVVDPIMDQIGLLVQISHLLLVALVRGSWHCGGLVIEDW